MPYEDEESDSLLDVGGFDDIEFDLVDDGDEVRLRIKSAGVHEKEGKRSLHVVFDLPEMPNADDIHTYVGIPTDDEDPKAAKRKRIRLAAFYTAFDVDFSGPVDLNTDLIGQQGYGIVGVEDWQGEPRNTIKSFSKRK